MKKFLAFLIVFLFAMTAMGAYAMPALAAEPVAVVEQVAEPTEVVEPAQTETEQQPIIVSIIEHGISVASTLLITAIGVAGAWISAKIGKKKELENVSAAADQVIQNAQLTVGELQQTLVDSYKASGNGKLTDAQIVELGIKLIEKTKAKMSDPALNLLQAAAVDVNALITGAGEDWIGKTKAAA